jgi:hypothetical protein
VHLRRPLVFFIILTYLETCFPSRRYSTCFFFFFFWIIIPAILPATVLGYYSMSASLMPNFFIVVSIYWKSASYRSSLDLSSFGETSNRSAAKLTCSFFFWTDVHATCRYLYDFVMTFLRSSRLHLARGLVRHGYPWVPTDQAHSRPC